MSVEPFVTPASFAQRRLWFIDQLDPGSALYHVPTVLGLRGSLDLAALHRALTTIVSRHEALRTTFTQVAGEPMQVIAPAREISLPLTDLSVLTAEDRDGEERRLVREAVSRPFDLAQGPLIRAHLLRMAPDEHLLVLVVHHIVFDGWSSGVLSRELSACYRAYSAGLTPELPELAIQYADYAAWQRECLSGELLDRQLAYWRDCLADAPTVLDLPTDFARPTVPSHRGASETHLLSAELLTELRLLSRSEQSTLFMTLLAGFQVLLGRYTDREDFLIGSPIANRTRAELEPLIGFFVNTLALRADLSGDPSFRGLLRRVRESSLGAYAHQDMPFERLVEELRPERAGDRNPLFQVMFVLQNTPGSRLELPGLTIRRLPRKGATAKFDLTLQAHEEERGLWLRLEYRADLFRPDSIRRMLESFETLLTGAVAHPDRPLSSMPLLGGAERTRVLIDWNRTGRQYPEHSVPALFEEQVRARPTAVAVEFGTQRLTYEELDRQANRLARHLREHGVAEQVRVGVVLERSVELIVALLAVLKAGGAYVPVDPAYPAERLEFMLEDAGVRVLVTNGTRPAAGRADLRIVDLQANRAELGRYESTAPGHHAGPDDLAYVMYTSGSTGQPKGIAIPHRAIARLVCNTDYVRLTPSDCIAQVSNPSFDALTFEVWGALLHGARLAIIDRDVALAPHLLAAELRERGVTTMFLTTALFNQLTVAVPDLLASLRQVLFGGEAVDPGRVRAVLRDGRPARLLHVYGPTEATTFSTWHEIETVPDSARTIPIGRPIANTTAYVLDRRLEPVPPGMPGELYLGGPGLAHGYLGRPGMTAARFVPDPFDRAGGRLYRTGDRVRRLADGSIEFMGRLDAQVKLRGFRIEPGEVEAALARHPAVRECAVVLRDDLPGGAALVAYVTPTFPVAGPRETGDRLDRTAQRIRQLEPRRVLEIGGGEGSLLTRLAPYCIRYMVADPALSTETGSGSRAPGALAGLDSLERAVADLVIVTEASHRYASPDQLLSVLEGASRALAPGGSIFVANIRHFSLLTAFHAAAELGRAPATLALDALRERVTRRAAAPSELAITPAFFTDLPRRLHRIVAVEVTPRRAPRGEADATYSYDAVLYSESPAPPTEPVTWCDWDGDAMSLAWLEQRLRERPAYLGLRRVPNGRIAADRHAAAALAGNAQGTAGELRDACRLSGGAGPDPETFWTLAEQSGYRVGVSWAAGHADGRYDVLFERPDMGGGRPLPWPREDGPRRRRGDPYGNQVTERSAGPGLVRDLRRHLRDHLPAYMIPSGFVLLDGLPLTPNGKLDRKALPLPHETEREAGGELLTPRTPTEERLARIWCELLGLDHAGVDDDFFERGGHSLLAVRLFAEIDRVFGRRLLLSTLYRAPTIRALAAILAESSAEGSASSLAVLQPLGSRPPLFLVHGVYGDVMEYRALVARLGSERPIYGVEVPVGSDQHAFLPTIPELAREYVREMRHQQPAGPYFLCGYCWAGALTFEMARQLVAEGAQVGLLALIDSGCPGSRQASSGARRRAAGPGRTYWRRLGLNLRRLADLEPKAIPEFLRERVANLAGRLGGPALYRWSVRLGRPLLPAFRGVRGALLQAVRSYQPERYPGRITLFRAQPVEAVPPRNPAWGWDRVAEGGVDVHLVPGEHLTIVQEPSVGALALELRTCLDRAEGEGAAPPVSRALAG